MERTRIDTPAMLIWSAVLGTAAIVGSYGFACMFPFAAMATVAALTLDRRHAFGLVAASWVVNQAVGFGLRDYPHTLDTAGWGIAIGIAAFAALVAAQAALGSARTVFGVRTVFALAAAFVAYEGALFAYALVAGGVETFAPRIVALIAVNDAVWFAGLIALRALVERGLPRVFGSGRIASA